MDPRAKSILAGKVFQDLLNGAPDRATCESRLSSNDADSEARYFFAVHLMVSDDVETAIEHLLTIVRTDREYNEDAARLLLIQIFDRLGNEDSRARAGRKQLAAILMV